MLSWCSLCKEKSVITKFNKRHTKRWLICINRGCHFKQETTIKKGYGYYGKQISGVSKEVDEVVKKKSVRELP